LLANDYICVTLAARYSGGAAAIERAGGKSSSNPWLAILDESGQRLAISTYEPPAAEDKARPSGAVQVEQILKATARKLTADEIQAVVASLWLP
jgi:hypothetical protein